MSNQKKRMIAYTIVKSKTANYWKEIGVAFQNKDNSWNLELFATPVNGKIQLRDAIVKPEENLGQ